MYTRDVSSVVDPETRAKVLKAYGKVDWKLLHVILRKMGFLRNGCVEFQQCALMTIVQWWYPRANVLNLHYLDRFIKGAQWHLICSLFS